MNENLKAFLQKASEDNTLQAKLTGISESAMSDAKVKLIKLAEENGFKFTEEDIDYATAESTQLGEDELNAVAGGAYTKKQMGKLYSDCFCVIGGNGTHDDLQKECACVLGGCGELTALGKQKANENEIWWDGAKGAKVAFVCAIAGGGSRGPM